MKPGWRVWLFFILPMIAPLLYPPATVLGALPAVGVALGLFALLGVFLWQGRSWALTFSIFLQGFNVIIRLMMFFSTAVTRDSTGAAQVNLPYIGLSLLAVGLSLWLLLRLDRVDVRTHMIA